MISEDCPITVRSPISGLEPTNYIAPDVRIKWRRARVNGMMLVAGLVSAIGVYVWNV
jgi:hypothetical protein